MLWFEFLVYVHIFMAVIWVGGSLMMQFFGIRAAMAGDPARMAVLGQDKRAGSAAGSWYRVSVSQARAVAPAG